MTTSKVASDIQREAAASAVTRLNKKFASLEAGIIKRYSDAGTSGKEQSRKELAALKIEKKEAMEKLRKKQADNIRSVKRFGKDAMRGRTFAQFSEGGMTKKLGNNDMRKGGMFK